MCKTMRDTMKTNGSNLKKRIHQFHRVSKPKRFTDISFAFPNRSSKRSLQTLERENWGKMKVRRERTNGDERTWSVLVLENDVRRSSEKLNLLRLVTDILASFLLRILLLRFLIRLRRFGGRIPSRRGIGRH